MAKFDKQYKFYAMTLLHAHAQYICIIYAKCLRKIK